jgi:hypothetical protein
VSDQRVGDANMQQLHYRPEGVPTIFFFFFVAFKNFLGGGGFCETTRRAGAGSGTAAATFDVCKKVGLNELLKS